MSTWSTLDLLCSSFSFTLWSTRCQKIKVSLSGRTKMNVMYLGKRGNKNGNSKERSSKKEKI